MDNHRALSSPCCGRRLNAAAKDAVFAVCFQGQPTPESDFLFRNPCCQRLVKAGAQQRSLSACGRRGQRASVRRRMVKSTEHGFASSAPMQPPADRTCLLTTQSYHTQAHFSSGFSHFARRTGGFRVKFWWRNFGLKIVQTKQSVLSQNRDAFRLSSI